MRGPEDNRRKSLQILETLVAVRLSTPDTCTYTPVSQVASTRLTERMRGKPVSARKASVTRVA